MGSWLKKVPLLLFVSAYQMNGQSVKTSQYFMDNFLFPLCYSASVFFSFLRCLGNNKFIRQCSELNVNFVSADSLSTDFSIVLSIWASFSNSLNTASVSRRSVTQRMDLIWI